MNIVEALHAEETNLHRQLTAIQGAIAALNGGAKTVVSPGLTSSPNGANGKRVMSAAVRARSAKAQWAKIRAEKAKKAK